MAVAILTTLSILGYALGWMHIRSIDAVAEFFNKPSFPNRTLERVMDAGINKSLNSFDQSCTTPDDSSDDVLNFGKITIEYKETPDPDDNIFKFTINAEKENKTLTLICEVLCIPPVPCPEWMTPEECAGGGGGGRQFILKSCQQSNP